MQFCPPPGTIFHGKSISDTAQEGASPTSGYHGYDTIPVAAMDGGTTNNRSNCSENTQLTGGDKDVQIDIGESS